MNQYHLHEKIKKMKYIIAALLTVIGFAASAQNKNIKTESFKVFGNCSQCKSRIEKAMTSMNVYKANWSIETNILTVSYDSLKLSKILRNDSKFECFLRHLKLG